MWAKRVLIGSSMAVASVLFIPAVSGADCVQTVSMQEPSCAVIPAVSGSSDTVTAATTGPTDPQQTAPVSGTTSLPFTGADVEELAVVGAGAVLAGGLLIRRRRHA